MSRPPLPADVVAEIQRLRYEERLSGREIAARFGYSEYVVYKYAPGKTASRYLTEDEVAEIKRLRYEEKKTCREVAEITGRSIKRIRHLSPGLVVGGEWSQLSDDQLHQIETLRYEDGMTLHQVAEAVGCHYSTVRRLAPGKPGKIDNSKLRQRFLDSGLSAGEVARRIGWFCDRNNGSHHPDSSRLKRALGILTNTSTKNGVNKKYVQKMIDGEVAVHIAEAIGCGAWEIGARE